MPPGSNLTADQLAAFERDGLLFLPGLLSLDRIARAREALLRPLEKLGLWQDGAWRLDSRPRPQWPSTGLKSSRDIGTRHPELEALIEDPALAPVVDALLGGHAFDRTIHKRPQPLVSLPNADGWTLPNGWHSDFPRLASGESPGIQLFTFLDPVEPQGGGTVVIAGSHRLLNDRGALHIRDITRLMRAKPFLKPLYARTWDGARLPLGRADDVPLHVVELTGNPGDAWLIDLRILHSAAPNSTARPRMMATHRFVRADLMAELAALYGWGQAPAKE